MFLFCVAISVREYYNVITTLERAFDYKGGVTLNVEEFRQLIINLIKGIDDIVVLSKIYTVIKNLKG